MDILTLILIAALIAALFFCASLYSRLSVARNSLATRVADSSRLLDRCADAESRLRDSEVAIARLQEQNRALTAEVNASKANRAADEKRFADLARTAITSEIDSMKKENESRLLELLVPFREQIEGFREQVGKCYSDESKERFALRNEIQRLVAQSENIGREARELSTALRGNSKTQGDWGEMILETLLEKSGLRRGEEFEVQQTRDVDGNVMRGEGGEFLRPDVVVYYPGRRAVVVDSKVSLTAFTEWVNADSDEAREAAGRRHVASVRAHVAELRQKNYQDFVSDHKLDFVLMFIPNESAYIAAMTIDPTLWQTAYESRVLIVSPTHLISVLRLVAQLWAHDRQTSNALKIAENAGKLYDKFVSFVDDMERIQRSIDAASATWQSAMKHLRDGRGNLMTRAEDLRKLGVKTRKSLRIEGGDDDADSDCPSLPYPKASE